MGQWWRWALLSPDGVAPSRMVNVSASANLPLHYNVQKFSSGTGSPGWPGKRAIKRLWCGEGASAVSRVARVVHFSAVAHVPVFRAACV